MSKKYRYEPIDYHKSFAIILKNLHGGQLYLRSAAMNLLIVIMNNFNEKLIENFANCCTKMHGSAIASAVEALDMTVAEQLKQCALAEGNKQVIQHRMGILVFKPEVPKPKKKPFTPRSKLDEYVPSVERVFRLVCPDESVNVGVLKAIAYLAREVSLRLITQARAEAGNTLMKPLHIKHAVDSMMGETMASHANAEAFRFLCLVDEGFIATRQQTPIQIYEAIADKGHKRQSSAFSKMSLWSSKG